MNGRIHPLLSALIVLCGAWLLFSYAFAPVMPTSLLIQYLLITFATMILYHSFDEERWQRFLAPLRALSHAPPLRSLRLGVLLLVPAVVGLWSYQGQKPHSSSPIEMRQTHPAPPSSFKAFGKRIHFEGLSNPIRDQLIANWEQHQPQARADYDQAVTAGRDLYYRNCLLCHGTTLDGQGQLASGLDPRPANFQDVGTIAQLEESYLFWRIATGDEGLPHEGGPWNSLMPAWHRTLSEQQVWQIITFLYDYVDQVPRIWETTRAAIMAELRDQRRSERSGAMGIELYQQRCSVCHGVEGAGDGAAAERLYPRPRDFTLGLMKFKSSPPQALPRDEDMIAVIRDGLPGTSMSGWSQWLTPAQIASLVPVIKRFDLTASWAPADAEDDAFDEAGHYIGPHLLQEFTIEPTQAQPPYDTASQLRGAEAFAHNCSECHGDGGHGNITSGKQLTDDWGARIWPQNLTTPWNWRFSYVAGGDTTARDATIRRIYQRLTIGIPGTPMPANRAVEQGNTDPLPEQSRWDIANYLYSQLPSSTPSQQGGRGMIEAIPITGPLPQEADDPLWQQASVTSLLLVPNLMAEPRLFNPLNHFMQVRALYNRESIALLIEVEDRTDSRPGEPYSESIQDESLPLYPDAIAVQLAAQPTTPTKPLLPHGDRANRVVLWYWQAGALLPPERPTTQRLSGAGLAKPLQPVTEGSPLTATGRWQDGRLRLVMQRALQGGEAEPSFVTDALLPIAFAHWDGSNGEQGARHSLTQWGWIRLQPQPRVWQRTAGALGAAMGIWLLLWWGMRRIRG